MNAKTKPTIVGKPQVLESETPVSFEDAGYRAARLEEGSREIAQYVLDNCPNILEDEPQDVKLRLFAGFQTWKHENYPSVFYKIGEGGNYIPVKPAKGETEGLIEVNINVAMAFSTQSFSALRIKDPELHKVMKKPRDDFSTYASSRWKSLLSKIREIVNAKDDGKGRKRGETLAFTDALVKMFDAYDTRCKAAIGRQDHTADNLKFRMARDAFWAVYKN